MGKYRNGLLIGTIALVIMLIASPATALPDYSSQFTTDTLDSSLNLEFVNIVAGKDLATYTNIFVFGGHDGSNMPVQDSASGLAETSAWVLVYADLSGFSAHLNRIPFEAPDGLTLMLVYPQGVFDTFSKAGNAKALFEAEYGVTMDLTFFDGGSLQSDFYIFYSVTDVFSTVASDVAGIDNDGFSNLMDATTVTSAPVGWAAYGARGLSSSRVGMHAMGWVDSSGLTKSGNVYSLSSDHVLGANIIPASIIGPSRGLSRVQFSFPYPITPLTISPATSNPLPHVTGKMMWDLRHPISSYTLPTAADYKVDYEISMDATFPNVQNKMSIDQTQLNQDGILEVLFELENIGGQNATDVTLSLPLGPDFGKIVDKNITIYTIKDGYTLDESINEIFTMELVTTPSAPAIEFDFDLFTLSGWYTTGGLIIDGGALADWNTTVTSLELFVGTVNVPVVGDIPARLTIYNPNGFPNSLLNAYYTHIDAGMPTTSVADVIAHAKENLNPMLRDTFQDSFDLFYQSEDKLIFDAGDFILEKIPVGVSPARAEDRWFLTKTISNMVPGEKVNVSFSLNDVPTTADKLALMGYSKGSDSGFPTATLISKEQDYNQFMQYAFEAFGFDGRPISFNLPDDFTLDFNSLFTSTYGSMGMFFTYKNDAGFPFFGLSNGQNVQIADDEAVIAATVALDKQSYTVGDLVSITVDLTNNGDIAATDIIVHLYHGTLGRDWQFERVDMIDDISVDDLAAGASTSFDLTVEANSYLGYHTVFAFVEFISDKDQAPEALPDFLDLGITEFSAGGETKHFSMSTLSGALLLPEGFLPEPSIPEPLLTMSTSIVGDDVNTAHLSAGEEFTYTVTIKNEGDASTKAAFVQTFDDSSLELVSVSSTEGTITKFAATASRPASVMVDGMTFEPLETVTVTIVFKLKGNSATLPPGIVSYSVDGESSLGASADTGFSINVSSAAASLLTVNADSAAQQESQKSGSEDSSSSAFSASSSVGANIATDDITESKITTDAVGFVGYGPEILGLMLVPLSIGVIAKRKRN